ncbi:MAG: ABC transporter ATP-binding protein [Acetobacteraceae bacterium]
MSALLEVEGVHAYYGKAHVLFGVSLSIGEGEIVTLLGRNGAGKTTTLRAITGLTLPREGHVRIGGTEVAGMPTHHIAKLGVGHVFEGRHVFKTLTVEENLRVPAKTAGQWNVKSVYGLFPRLQERRTSRASRLSGGEQEMLAIARALLLNPRLLLLDEPSQGLAPVIVQGVMETIKMMRDQGTAVLLVEQNAFIALAVADRCYVLSDGAIVHSGPAKELAADPDKVKSLAGAKATKAA